MLNVSVEFRSISVYSTSTIESVYMQFVRVEIELFIFTPG
jgi:hypothetical protein